MEAESDSKSLQLIMNILKKKKKQARYVQNKLIKYWLPIQAH